MTSRAFLLLGFLIIILISVSAAHAETIAATPSESVINNYNYKYSPAEHGGGCDMYVYNFATGASAGEAARACKAAKSGQTVTYSNCSNNVQGVPICDVNYSTSGFQGHTNVANAQSGCLAPAVWNGSACVEAVYSCPANQGWTLQGSTCSRPDCPYARNPDGTCQGQCDGKTATGAPPAIPSALYSSAPSLTCVNGCVAKRYTEIVIGPSGYDYITKIQNGQPVNYYNYVYDYADDGTNAGNGVACSSVSSSLASSSPPIGLTTPDQIQQSCASGQTGGYVNGRYTCVSNTTSDQTSQETVATPQTTTTTTATNPDGSTTTTKTTTYPDGSKTVETTTTPSGGGNPSSSTTQHVDAHGNPVNTSTAGGASGGATNTANVKDGVKQGLEQYCVSHPNSPVCKEEGDKTASGGTACDAAPACSGDPIQCAVLYQQWKNRCEAEKSNERVTEGGDWGNSQIDSAGTETNPLSNPTEINILSGWDTTDLLAGHTCPAPIQMVTPFGTYSLPFDKFCDLAAIIGNFILIFASFLSFRMVIGAL